MNIALVSCAAIAIGAWLLRLGLRQLRADWRTVTPRVDRLIARAVHPMSPPAKTRLDQFIIRLSHWTRVLGGILFLLLGVAGLVSLISGVE